MPAAIVLAMPHAGSAQPEADQYLQKMAQSTHATYHARQLVVYLGPPQSAAVLEVRATPGGTFLRAEAPNVVTRVWRDAEHGLISQQQLAIEDMAPPAVPLEPATLMSKYEIQVGSPSLLLGVTTIPLALVRREDRRLVERLWVQPDNGLVYRRELYGQTGGVIGMATMLDMDWGDAEEAETYEGTTPTKVLTRRTTGAPSSLPYGYRLRSAYAIEANGHRGSHWLYSDGLHALSVFRIPGTMRPPANYRAVDLVGVRGWAGPGPGTWMWEGGGSIWAVVAEEAQLDPVVLTAAFPKGGRPLLARMGSWWAHALHWILSRAR